MYPDRTTPGHRRLIKYLDKCLKTSHRSVKELESLGLIAVNREKYHTNVYTLAPVFHNPFTRIKLAFRFPQLTNLRKVYLGDLFEFAARNVPLLKYTNEYDTYINREDSIISPKREEFSSKSVNAVGEPPPATYNAYPYSDYTEVLNAEA
jgi:hypothetical protein